MKKSIFIGIALAALMSVQALAGEITINVDSSNVEFAEDAAQPFIDNGTTFVPLRGVFEKMGYKVIWDNENKQAILTGTAENDVIVISPESSVVKFGGLDVDMGTSPVNVNGSLMLPLRAVANIAECETKWDAETKTIDITTKAQLQKKAAELEAEAQRTAEEQKQADEEAQKQKEELEAARAAAKQAEQAAEDEKNFDYSEYPNKVLEIADTLDAKLAEAYAVAVRNYVKNSDMITPYSDKLSAYAKETETTLSDLTVKDSQADIKAAYDEYYNLVKTSISLINGSAGVSYNGGTINNSSTKGDRALGSKSAYNKFKEDFEKNQRAIDKARTNLNDVCKKYLAKINN